MKLFNLHTHTKYSDGNADPEAYVKEAIAQGFDILGFSEHSPLPFLTPFAIKEGLVEEYYKHIDKLKRKYEGKIKIYKSFEFDFIPSVSFDFTEYSASGALDYIIGAVHLVKSNLDDRLWFIDGPLIQTYDDGLEHLFGGDIKKAVSTYYHQVNEMILTQDFDILAHFDKIKMHNQGRYFREEEQWYIDLVNETIQLIKERGLIVEVNTRGIYKKRSDALFPDIWILKKLHELKIPLTISSDAHQPHEISLYFLETLQILKDIGIRELTIWDNNNWISRSI